MPMLLHLRKWVRKIRRESETSRFTDLVTGLEESMKDFFLSEKKIRSF